VVWAWSGVGYASWLQCSGVCSRAAGRCDLGPGLVKLGPRLPCGGRSGAAWGGRCGLFACQCGVSLLAPGAQPVALWHGHGVVLEQLPQAVRTVTQRRVSLHSLHTLCVVGGWGVLSPCCIP
jgi:hypothetical protein